MGSDGAFVGLLAVIPDAEPDSALTRSITCMIDQDRWAFVRSAHFSMLPGPMRLFVRPNVKALTLHL
jgi:hypothetical protein